MSLTRRRFTPLTMAATSLLRADDLPTVEFMQVKARRKPNDAWHEYPTRTLDRVAGFQPGARSVKTGIYGGRTDRNQSASGFFRTSKTGARWYLIDPDGNPPSSSRSGTRKAKIPATPIPAEPAGMCPHSGTAGGSIKILPLPFWNRKTALAGIGLSILTTILRTWPPTHPTGIPIKALSTFATNCIRICWRR